jgi:hypothetical protein
MFRRSFARQLWQVRDIDLGFERCFKLSASCKPALIPLRALSAPIVGTLSLTNSKRQPGRGPTAIRFFRGRGHIWRPVRAHRMVVAHPAPVAKFDVVNSTLEEEAMRKLTIILTAAAAVLFAGVVGWKAEAMTSPGAGIGAVAMKASSVEKAACFGRGRFCRWGRHRVCGPRHCWCAPC